MERREVFRVFQEAVQVLQVAGRELSHLGDYGAVNADDSTKVKSKQESCYVAEADERFRVCREGFQIQEVCDAHGAVASPCAKNRLY